jgi:hypothetical protein
VGWVMTAKIYGFLTIVISELSCLRKEGRNSRWLQKRL